MHAGGEYHGHWRGTPHYVCPELKAFGKNRGVLKHGDRIDVYAIGMTMKEVAPKLNRRCIWQRNFEVLVEKMMHLDPQKRPTPKGILQRVQDLDRPTQKPMKLLKTSKRVLAMIDAAEQAERLYSLNTATPSASQNTTNEASPPRTTQKNSPTTRTIPEASPRTARTIRRLLQTEEVVTTNATKGTLPRTVTTTNEDPLPRTTQNDSPISRSMLAMIEATEQAERLYSLNNTATPSASQTITH